MVISIYAKMKKKIIQCNSILIRKGKKPLGREVEENILNLIIVFNQTPKQTIFLVEKL